MIVTSGGLNESENPLCRHAGYQSQIFQLIPQLIALDGLNYAGKKGFYDLTSLVDSIVQDPILQSFSEYLDDSTMISQPKKSQEANRTITSQQDFLLDRIDQLENHIKAIKQPEQPFIVQETIEKNRMANLETQMGRILDAITSKEETNPSHDKKEQSKSTGIPEAHTPLKKQDEERLESIETQMKELIRLAAGKDTPTVIIKSEKIPANTFKQRKAFKELERQMFGPFSPTSSDDPCNASSKKVILTNF